MALATVGIVSLGEMGVGIAKLLAAHGFEVLTNVTSRSAATQKRAADASIASVSSDEELALRCDYLLSIVPPRDAKATADRVFKALNANEPKSSSLYFLDLNAIAPSTSKAIAKSLESLGDKLRFVDGGIIGGPPKLKTDGSDTWTKPSIVLSGPHPLSSAPKSGSRLQEVLGAKHVNDDIGAASGLKCCFASLSKGFTALALQSMSTAQSLGVLSDLEEALGKYNPGGLEKARRGIPGCVTKSGRWVEEMREIGKTFREDGGWNVADLGESSIGTGVFDGIAEVFETLAQDAILGKETIETRSRGKTMEDAVDVLLQNSLRPQK